MSKISKLALLGLLVGSLAANNQVQALNLSPLMQKALGVTCLASGLSYALGTGLIVCMDSRPVAMALAALKLNSQGEQQKCKQQKSVLEDIEFLGNFLLETDAQLPKARALKAIATLGLAGLTYFNLKCAYALLTNDEKNEAQQQQDIKQQQDQAEQNDKDDAVVIDVIVTQA